MCMEASLPPYVWRRVWCQNFTSILWCQMSSGYGRRPLRWTVPVPASAAGPPWGEPDPFAHHRKERGPNRVPDPSLVGLPSPPGRSAQSGLVWTAVVPRGYVSEFRVPRPYSRSDPLNRWPSTASGELRVVHAAQALYLLHFCCTGTVFAAQAPYFCYTGTVFAAQAPYFCCAGTVFAAQALYYAAQALHLLYRHCICCTGIVFLLRRHCVSAAQAS